MTGAAPTIVPAHTTEFQLTTARPWVVAAATATAATTGRVHSTGGTHTPGSRTTDVTTTEPPGGLLHRGVDTFFSRSTSTALNHVQSVILVVSELLSLYTFFILSISCVGAGFCVVMNTTCALSIWP